MGTATKEVMATAPVIVLLYDRTFLAGSFTGALRKRWGLYAGLAACWGLLALLMFSAGTRGGTVGFGAIQAPDWWSYAKAEFVAVPHYLRLSLWPDSLCLDYGISIARPLPQVVCGAAMVGLLAAGTLWGLLRSGKWGFLGAWFFVILAPTSSVVPLCDPVFEHRMYLSLAAVAAAAVMGGFLLWRKLIQSQSWMSDQPAAAQWAVPGIVLTAVAVALGALTVARNGQYQTALTFWQDTVDKNPANPRVHDSLAHAYFDAGMVPQGMECLREVVRLDPQNVKAHNDLGGKLLEQGSAEEASEQFRQAIRIAPQTAPPHFNLGMALTQMGQLDPAADEFRQTIRIDPQHSRAHNSLGWVLGKQEKYDAAAAEFREAIRLDPGYAPAYRNLAAVLDKLGRNDEAAEARNRAGALESAQRRQ
jgi:Tfp pilus assembly protein PilF